MHLAYKYFSYFQKNPASAVQFGVIKVLHHSNTILHGSILEICLWH